MLIHVNKGVPGSKDVDILGSDDPWTWRYEDLRICGCRDTQNTRIPGCRDMKIQLSGDVEMPGSKDPKM